MVPSIARQSVIIKCNMQKSVLTGNYEYYYAAGLCGRLCGIDIPEDIAPAALRELLADALENAATKDEKEAWLVGMLKDYMPDATCDAQTAELFRMGKEEGHLWQVQV